VTRRLLVLAVLAAVALPGAQAAPPRPVPSFDHVIVIVFENKERGSVLGNRSAPTFNSLASRSAVLAGYRGVTHPSLPNYLALVSGSTQGVTDDCTSCSTGGRSLADTLEAKGRTWKTYAEGLPRSGWTGAATGRYVKRHVPFLYFRRVLTRPARLRNVVPLTALSRDLAAKRLPDFSLVVPDMCHDMHDCSVATGDAWLKRFVPPLLRSRQLANSAVFIVFDESDSADPRVAGLALGPLVRPGSVYAPAMSHYGLLRTIEDAWGLPRLGRSARVTPVAGIWR
jgi:acid phosphatase